MTSHEDMDPAYAESMAGQFELLGHALRRFLKATYAELGKILDPTDPTVASDDRPYDVVDGAGLSRVRGKCVDITCTGGRSHIHIIDIDLADFGLGHTTDRRPPARPSREPDLADGATGDGDRPLPPSSFSKPGIRKTVSISTQFGEEVHWEGCPRTKDPGEYCDCV